MYDAPYRSGVPRFLPVFLSFAFACSPLVRESDADRKPILTDNEIMEMLHAVTADYWDPINSSAVPGLLCIPAVGEAPYNTKYIYSSHLSHFSCWPSIPIILLELLQEDADRLYSQTDQTSGRLISRANAQGFPSMRRLYYSYPQLNYSAMIATLTTFYLFDGRDEPMFCCYHFEKNDAGRWQNSGRQY